MGLDFCAAALKQGHKLTLYVRNPTKIPPEIASSDDVTVIKGNLEDVAGLEQATASGATHFVSFAGPTVNSKGTVSNNTPEALLLLSWFRVKETNF